VGNCVERKNHLTCRSVVTIILPRTRTMAVTPESKTVLINLYSRHGRPRRKRIETVAVSATLQSVAAGHTKVTPARLDSIEGIPVRNRNIVNSYALLRSMIKMAVGKRRSVAGGLVLHTSTKFSNSCTVILVFSPDLKLVCQRDISHRPTEASKLSAYSKKSTLKGDLYCCSSNSSWQTLKT
jgi:hypothetical protein